MSANEHQWGSNDIFFILLLFSLFSSNSMLSCQNWKMLYYYFLCQICFLFFWLYFFFFMFVPFKKLIFFAIHHSILAWLGTELYDFFDEIISVHDPGHRFVNSSWQYQSFSRSFFYTYFFSISSFNIRFVENQALLFSLPSFLWDYFGLITWITGLAI
jgi:hypothetical protein